MKKLSLLTIGILLCLTSFAQQALWGGTPIVSPEVHDDYTVTFRFKAPNADTVQITGDFLPTEKIKTPMGLFDGPGKAYLKKDANGIWTYTSESLKPELYGYSFIVDGLKSTDPNNAFLIRDVATVTNIFLVGGGPGGLYKVNDVPHGTVARRWYDSPGLNMKRRLTIYTPPGYESSTQEYPVLYLLHGAGGDEEAWMALGRLSQIMDNLIAEGKAKPMIVVMPNGNVTQEAAPGEGIRGFYKPQFMEPKTMSGSYIGTFMDIINFVEKNYKVKANKENRAIAGLSMGGFHSLHISRYFPNTFDYVGLFSPAIMPNANVQSKVFDNFDSTLKAQMDNGYKLYWIGIGKSDFLYKAVADYRAELDKMGMKYTYVETDGGHIWKNWRIYISDFAPLLFK
ncbi:hypothetical protein PbJCM13498_27210 [Prolixibacter bellariivorans]|uniref:Esterase n=1 Tax=Prolixibacter bellariivorans TaxID=314319 RepID=A0A5M4B1N8_9BACT|nr:esterase [Prolixibacter bellariivorans]GET33858.1 hypothetical protein PbJCM13498_27210 [Prolixibacter bellariivorans]